VLLVRLRAAWLAEHDNNKRLDGVLAKAIKRMKNRLLAAGWDMWMEKLAWVKKKQKLINRWKQPMLAKGFYGCVCVYTCACFDRDAAGSVLVIFRVSALRRQRERRRAGLLAAWACALEQVAESTEVEQSLCVHGSTERVWRGEGEELTAE
jgi:hypothetical protein